MYRTWRPVVLSLAVLVTFAALFSIRTGSLEAGAPLAQTPVPGCDYPYADVPSTDPFFSFIRCLSCRGIVGGYSDLTFRPYNPVTRGQAAKIVVGAAGFSDDIPAGTQSFNDVPPGNPFWRFVEQARLHGIIGGYDDGSFRPFNNMTRGQLSKVVVNAVGWTLANPPAPTFVDVPPTNPFYREIETAAQHGVISGYSLPGGLREFRWGNDVTRGQTSKMVAQAFFPGCDGPGATATGTPASNPSNTPAATGTSTRTATPTGSPTSSPTIRPIRPELIVTKRNNLTDNTAFMGSSWEWSINIHNYSYGNATFETGQRILVDELPDTNISYSAVRVSASYGFGGMENLTCAIRSINNSTVLECVAQRGQVGFGPGVMLGIYFVATPSAVGTYSNPRAGGRCKADPDDHLVEDSEENNDCSNNVTVIAGAPDLRVQKANNLINNTGYLGSNWTWRIAITNTGSFSATYTPGQRFFVDNLPTTNISYSGLAVTSSDVEGANNIDCAISSSSDLECRAVGGPVSIRPGGGVVISFVATPGGRGSYYNPRNPGRCMVDPDRLLLETDERNNDCADGVAVLFESELTATKTNNLPNNSTLIGGSWTWSITITNASPVSTTFTAGRRFFVDDLPTTNISYSGLAVTSSDVEGADNIDCRISNTGVLQCSAVGGPVTIRPGGRISISVVATPGPTGRGTFTNPRSPGRCMVDPDLYFLEPDENNNHCSNTVTVLP